MLDVAGDGDRRGLPLFHPLRPPLEPLKESLTLSGIGEEGDQLLGGVDYFVDWAGSVRQNPTSSEGKSGRWCALQGFIRFLDGIQLLLK